MQAMATAVAPKPKAVKYQRSRKPPAIKTAVIAKYSQGQNKASIAKDLGITRNTVRAIVNESDIDRHLAANQATSLGLIPEAIRAAHERLKLNSETMAIEVLRNTIWPLNGKATKGIDNGVAVAIQNLMLGPTQVNVAPAADSTTISSDTASQTDAPADNSNVINKP